MIAGKSGVKEADSREELGAKGGILMKEDKEEKKIFTESEMKAFDGREGDRCILLIKEKSTLFPGVFE